MRIKRRMIQILLALIVAYIAVVVYMAVNQRAFIYFPSKRTESAQLAIAGNVGIEAWRDGQGQLIGWKSKALGKPPANRMLVFHGNAGQAVDRHYFVDVFTALDKGQAWEVFVLEYPGYGARAGSPTEPNLLDAAEAAIASLQKVDNRPLFLLGESLGSGVASQMAARHPKEVAGIFLITPFTSMTDIAVRQYPFLPVRLLLRDRYESEEALKKYSGPMAVLLAERDSIIPVQFGNRLYDGYTGEKRLWVERGADHNDIDYDADRSLWREVSDFLTAATKPL